MLTEGRCKPKTQKNPSRQLKPGPRISCAELGPELEPGPKSIRFSGDMMTILVAGHEEIQVDLSGLDAGSKKPLRKVEKKLFA
jgi:hypothetical protein